MLPSNDRFRVTVTDDGLMDLGIHGILTREDVDQFYAGLRPIDTMLRERFGRVLALISVSIVQSPTVALYFRARGISFVKPGDSCALLVATMLSKLQIKRLMSGDNFALFTDREAALAWLRR